MVKLKILQLLSDTILSVEYCWRRASNQPYILSNSDSMYLCMFVHRFSPLQSGPCEISDRCKAPGNRLRIAYGQTVGTKVVPHSITSVGLGADPGFLAISPRVT